jgi:protein SCO1
MTAAARARTAVGALAGILAITAGWWALALWPASADTPEWVARTRTACFGATESGLPEAGGWILLIGQPLGMLGFLAIVWRQELRAGLTGCMSRVSGQLGVGIASALIVSGLWATTVRVRTAGLEQFPTGGSDIAAQLTRVNDLAPALSLVDQSGREVTLESYRGRPVLVGFAFAHCTTVCPLIVSDMLAAQRSVEGTDTPAVLIVTLDPWRDTPSRLPSMARGWDLPSDAHVLSGPPPIVERALNAWRVPRVRNEKTGDLVHPYVVYIVDRQGRIAYAVSGSPEAMAAAIQDL